MSYAESHVVSITTSTGGGATGYTPVITGTIRNVVYTEASTPNDFSTTVDFTITLEDSGIGVWTESDIDASKTVSPTQPIHDQVGALRSSSTAAANDLGGPIVAARERVKIVIAQGGDSKEGTFRIIVQ